MASTPAKRHLAYDGNDNSDTKRIRSNDGSPAPAPNGDSTMQSEAERKKAEAIARMAAVKARLAASKTNAVPPPPPPADDMEAKKAEAARRIAEVKARMAAKKAQTSTASPSTTTPKTATPPPQQQQAMTDVQQRIAEARARAAEIAKQRLSAAPTPPPRQDSSRGARGGLGINLHPSLMGGPSSSTPTSSSGPKFSTTKGNQPPSAPQLNPYLTTTADEEQTGQDQAEGYYDPTIAARKGGDRRSKQLLFNPKGKFITQANALRQQAKLEEMKRRIAAETRKTEIEEAGDKAFLIPVPPEVEWWDENLISSRSTYSPKDFGAEDSIITNLVQHPVILQAPQDKLQPPPKPLMLTPTEQKKLRRQRRMADMKEEQAKIRLGLIDPPAPKVKKSNMMRVLGEQAVKDPTAVEARVNKEIAGRKAKHEADNADRALTKEQKAEKLKVQQEADAKKGVRVAVFRVESLASGKHRYLVDVNAKQNALTGLVVLHREMNLVVVEGGGHSVEAYKKLMLQRVKWSENTLPLSNASGPSTFMGANDGTKKYPASDANNNPNTTSTTSSSDNNAGANKAATWLTPLDDHGNLKDLSENSCRLVWEGQEAARAFKRWGSRAVETDGEARDVLGRMGSGGRMEGFWTLARSLGVED